MVPAAVGAVATRIEPAAAAPVGSATGRPHTSFAQLFAKNARNMQASIEPCPNRASACAWLAHGTGTSGGALPAVNLMPTRSERPGVCPRPALLGSSSTQYSGMRQLDGMRLNEMGMLPSFGCPRARICERPAL